MRYKITIEYDGTDYIGWQKQPDQPLRSIEELLQKAIFVIIKKEIKITCAGRTDAGVHAFAQIADFEIEKEIAPFNMMMALNQGLAHTKIIVINCEIVDEKFSSRFNCKWRAYRYIIINRKAPLVIDKNRAWHVPVKIDVARMEAASHYLIGEHDFSAFRDAECQSISAVKIIYDIKIIKQDERIFIDIKAKSFLHHMVRNIVGTLVYIGTGKMEIDDMQKILEGRNRTKSGPNAPAVGLYFSGAGY